MYPLSLLAIVCVADYIHLKRFFISERQKRINRFIWQQGPPHVLHVQAGGVSATPETRDLERRRERRGAGDSSRVVWRRDLILGGEDKRVNFPFSPLAAIKMRRHCFDRHFGLGSAQQWRQSYPQRAMIHFPFPHTLVVPVTANVVKRTQEWLVEMVLQQLLKSLVCIKIKEATGVNILEQLANCMSEVIACFRVKELL